jgi:hypothetical protein
MVSAIAFLFVVIVPISAYWRQGCLLEIQNMLTNYLNFAGKSVVNAPKSAANTNRITLPVKNAPTLV